MIVLEKGHQELLDIPTTMDILGIGIVSITEKNSNLIYRKGISRSLMNDLITLYRPDILEKKEGKLIDLLGIFTVSIHFYSFDFESIAIFYVNEKDTLTNYDVMCSVSRGLARMYCSNATLATINETCNKIIPSYEGLSALFVISTTGHTLFTKIREDKVSISKNYIQIGGFLSAILMFSNEVIGRNTGDTLQEINFENQQFLISVKEDIIFAYLLESSVKSELLKRYMDLIAEEFLDQFRERVKNFNGDLNQFHKFESIVDKYFCLKSAHLRI
ncbi:MAG: hypothetical protein KGD57_08820 [Candidatus Lokiarchaeota archaeon]|nr:hypothetical protein [Candidatus Lokiarchaeota archaeon]